MELSRLCELNGTSGDENAVRSVLLSECARLCDNVHIDRAGNVIAFKKGTRKSGRKHIVVCAHMDEVGFIITDATDDGYLCFRPVGSIDPRVCVSKHVRVGKKALSGVIGAVAIHLQTAQDREKMLQFEQLYIDIGAAERKEALEECPIGSYAYFDEAFERFGDGYAVSKALDDRVGCYTLLRLLKEDLKHDLTCAFVVKEEIGSRGAYAAAWESGCDAAIILEGTAAGDLGCVDESRRVCSVGKGVAISFMDKSSIGSRALFGQLEALARQNGIRYQIKEGVTGGNDARAFQQVCGGHATCVLSVPCRYIHGPSSVVKLSDVDDQLKLTLRALCEL